MKNLFYTLVLVLLFGLNSYSQIINLTASDITIEQKMNGDTVHLFFINKAWPHQSWNNYFYGGHELFIFWNGNHLTNPNDYQGLQYNAYGFDPPTSLNTTWTSKNMGNVLLHPAGDTICHIFHVYPKPLTPTCVYVNHGGLDSYLYGEVGCLKLSPLLAQGSFKPCYVSVDPIDNKPKIYWENDHTMKISKYVVKHNGLSIDTINYNPILDVLTYKDIANNSVNQYIQEYAVEAIDSFGIKYSNIVTTIHAVNLSTTNNGVELQWNIPVTPLTTASFKIYEMYFLDSLKTKDTLINIGTVYTPSNATSMSYSIANPNPSHSYLVGIEGASCSGTAKLKSGNSNLFLSNKVKQQSQANIVDLLIDKEDIIIGYSDLLGKSINPKITGQLILVKYQSGKTVKIINP